MGKTRFFLLVIVFAAGTMSGYMIYTGKLKTPMEMTFSPVYQLFGRTTSSINRALTKIIPVDALDEKEFGDAIASSLERQKNKGDIRMQYVNDLIGAISKYKKKPFDYRVFLLDDSYPNAFALPGGVIVVTDGLLATLKSEAELAAIFAHEIGHIELSHCLDAVRFQLLADKVGAESLGKLADIAVNTLVRHTYSQTQEDDADAYAWGMILNTVYNPYGLGRAFASLLAHEEVSKNMGRSGKGDLIREYLMSHPHTVHRMEKYTEKAKRWWNTNKGARKYNGKKNLREMRAFPSGITYPGEWDIMN